VNLQEISAAARFDILRNFLVCVWLFWECTNDAHAVYEATVEIYLVYLSEGNSR
jgi:hypothetical protein